jgi:hypothetical protein
MRIEPILVAVLFGLALLNEGEKRKRKTARSAR